MILVLTDLHAFLPAQKEKTKELIEQNPSSIFLLGDIRGMDVEYIRDLYEGPIYFLYGNHDEYDDYNYIPGLTNFHGECVEVEGLKFAGIEGCVRYKECGVAHTQEEVMELVETLPNCDILLSHEGPETPWSNKVAHQGYRGINKYLQERKPELHIHGHRHENKAYYCESVLCISLYKCAVLDTEEKKVKRVF